MDLPLESLETGVASRGLEMEDDIQGWKSRSLAPSSVDFPNTSLQSVAYNRRTHFARHGNTQARVL
jgi:hypothetical protein